MNKNLSLNTDSYKVSMWKQYPEGTEAVYSYIEARGNDEGFKETVFFGLQAFIREYLSDPVTENDVRVAEAFWTAHGEPFNIDGWMYIVDELEGVLPITIHALPEGTPISNGTVMLTIENTDPKCFWLTTWLETALLRAIWYPSTVATMSREAKKIIAKALHATGDIESLPFKLHDFGARGVSSEESATLGGMSHLVNFSGTDTMSGVLGAYMYYDEQMAGFSIPASEHSTITSWGKDFEVDAYANMLEQFKDSPLVAVVSDSYDIYNAVNNLWGDALIEKVKARKGFLIVRPDSGDPVTVVTKVAIMLDDKFGSEINELGYKVLNNVRIMQGDGIDLKTIQAILDSLKAHNFSANNIAFGMGGALLQGWTRDTFKFAMKCSAIKVNGEWRDVFKDPITDKVKKSKKGRFAVHYDCGLGSCGFRNVPEFVNEEKHQQNYLEPVWNSGRLLREESFSEVRERAALKESDYVSHSYDRY